MKSAFLVSALIIVATLHCDVFGQQRFSEDDPECMKINEYRDTLAPVIDFLAESPQIDGYLDGSLRGLPVRAFNYVRSHAEKPFEVPLAHYRLGYGTEFFYMYLEVEADEIMFNDRAFQYGDGFQLLLAKPKPDNQPTDEFYVIACSAVNQADREWTRKIAWVYNLSEFFVRLSDDTRMIHQFDGKKISFELYLPWKDIPPFHPWLSRGIGFNLKLVKAYNDIPLRYFYVCPDRYLAWGFVKPIYSHLEFQRQIEFSDAQQFVRLSRNNICEGDSLFVHIAGGAPAATAYSLDVDIHLLEDTADQNRSLQYVLQPGVNTIILPIGVAPDLPNGNYEASWTVPEGTRKGQAYLTVIRNLASDDLKSRLSSARHSMSKGSFETIDYGIDRCFEGIQSLKPYETDRYVNQRMNQLITAVEQAGHGVDIVGSRTGFFRRAFLSGIDSSYQPYCVRVPEGFSRSQKYPLIVFLHGSESDETDLAGFPFTGGNDCIQLGPFARGTSNWYGTANAQLDIAEAIDAGIDNYPIDTTNIILTGSSMGGYGVLRTFLETPGAYKAIAIFSGRPYASLDTLEFPDSIYPNFLDPRKLSVFSGVPVFIYHGEEDQGYSGPRMQAFADLLREEGADVTIVIGEGKGHDKPEGISVGQYQTWLQMVLHQDRMSR